MTDPVHLVVCVFAVFTALGLACAVTIGRRRRPPAGRPSHRTDPRYCRDLQRVYSREQLEAIARRDVKGRAS
jgi:hypothetical protein